MAGVPSLAHLRLLRLLVVWVMSFSGGWAYIAKTCCRTVSGMVGTITPLAVHAVPVQDGRASVK